MISNRHSITMEILNRGSSKEKSKYIHDTELVWAFFCIKQTFMTDWLTEWMNEWRKEGIDQYFPYMRHMHSWDQYCNYPSKLMILVGLYNGVLGEMYNTLLHVIETFTNLYLNIAVGSIHSFSLHHLKDLL
jgi:hypothetical protein